METSESSETTIRWLAEWRVAGYATSSVRTDTPKSLASFACDSPVRSRIPATEGTLNTRPVSPRFSRSEGY